MKRDISELRSMQALPLDLKVSMTKARIRQWVHEYDEEGVYVALSGGKDSTVLSHIVDDLYPDNHIPRVHVRTGLEYPEIEKFCETFHDLVILKPKMTFKQVIEKYGYPFISKEVSEAVYGAKRWMKQKREEQKCIYCDNLLGKKGCLGMCNKHYIQYKRWGDPLHADKKERATIDGYYRDGKTGRREHRIIYENYYGIKLTDEEVVHHINFVKTDNRIENLWK